MWINGKSYISFVFLILLIQSQVDLDAALPSVCSWNLALAQSKTTPKE